MAKEERGWGERQKRGTARRGAVPLVPSPLPSQRDETSNRRNRSSDPDSPPVGRITDVRRGRIWSGPEAVARLIADCDAAVTHVID